MGAQQSLETLDDMMRCDGCRGSNKDTPEHDFFNMNPPKHSTESKEERLSRLVGYIMCPYALIRNSFIF
jgi:hypothetical protein